MVRIPLSVNDQAVVLTNWCCCDYSNKPLEVWFAEQYGDTGVCLLIDETSDNETFGYLLVLVAETEAEIISFKLQHIIL